MNKTGGPAFPTQSKLGVNEASTWIAEIPGQPGMTLRDYFAAKAMLGILTVTVRADCDNYREDVLANLSYTVADAMLKAREA